MPYVYSDADSLEGKPKVGSKQCVALIEHYVNNMPRTVAWTEGEAVMKNATLTKGTVIATFVDGKYQSHSSGNHAAFFLKQDVGGIWVMDQWLSDKTKPVISSRYISRRGKLSNGKYADPSNNADAYSVVN